MKLSEITSPAAIKDMTENELEGLAQEIREKIIRTVALNGGHLASNMGAVELTIALHRALDCPKDKLVFDGGHQCYTHKILTGRIDRFSTLRKTDGICGFPRRDESPYDAFDTGHASTAISAALSMARARDMKGEKWHVAAVVGDGAMTGGMCYEALNDAGSSQIPMMVVLNDNGMSISRNVGALSGQLTKVRVSRGWLGAK
ncbi:MAG: 1-deoxy-D-xylulose-5-phosphate synthase, partial [Clostridia bacterium]|nr:1-deoxy-D-xylulose-5-phosphate synthase [Clostridia bacterium]